MSRSDFEGIKKDVYDVGLDEFKGMVDEMEQDLKSTAHEFTGALRESIDSEKITDFKYSVAVNPSKLKSNPKNPSGEDYSMAYWQGRKKSVAKKGKALKIRLSGSNPNDVIFRKSAKATKGHDFVNEAIDKFNSNR